MNTTRSHSSRQDLLSLTQWITTAAMQDGAGLAERVMKQLNCSRSAALAKLRRLEESQWLVRSGVGRKARWRPGEMRQVVRRYPLQGLQEDLPWRRDFAPYLSLSPEVARLAQHAFTELLNNAIEHSGGAQVTISLRQTAMHLQMLVSDDGCGVFEHINRHCGVADPDLAMLELSKGKLTSAPQGHSGRGLFFTSRLGDVFDLHANHHAYQQRGWETRTWHRSRALPRHGTSAYLAIALDTTRTVDAVLQQHSATGQDYGFDTTQVSLALLTGPNTGLESRAQARRVAERLTQFRRAEIDFSGINELGHAFADELFRVFAHQHPEVELVTVGATPQVAALLDSVRAAA